MVRIRHADFGIGAATEFACKLEGDDPRDISLERQQLQVKHEPCMVGVRGGDARRAIEIRQRIVARRRFGSLDPALHLADAAELVIDADPVSRPQLPLEFRHVFADPIEQAGPFAECRASVVNASALAKESLENHARMRLGRKRRRW